MSAHERERGPLVHVCAAVRIGTARPCEGLVKVRVNVDEIRPRHDRPLRPPGRHPDGRRRFPLREPDQLFGISESLWRQVVDKTGGNADVGQSE